MLEALPHTLLLVLAIAALGGAARRIASLLVPGGLARVLAVLVLVAGAAAAEALIVGWVGLGMSPYALAAAAAATWLLARWRCHAPSISLFEDARRGWVALATRERIVLGAACGAWVAWTVWAVAEPVLGYDMVVWHLPEAVGWVQEDNAGGRATVVVGAPVDTYPAVAELLNAWVAAIGRTLVPFSLMPMVIVAVLATSFWVGLRALHVARVPTALGAGAICLVPTVLGWQSNGAPNDPAALAWAAACAALCVASRDRPRLLVAALVAAGLAIGTKGTAGAAVVLSLGIALFVHRARLRPLALPLAAGALVGAVVGLYWYGRNLVEYGSPLWPFVAAPWGEPVPLVYQERLGFIDVPIETLEGLAGYWGEQFVAQLLLFGGLALAVVAWPRRSVLACGAVALVGVAAWMVAPTSGLEELAVAAFSSTRYMLPAIGAAAAGIALLALAGGWRERAAVILLAAACAAGLGQTLALDEFAPSPLVPLAGLAVGAGLAAIGSRVALPWLAPPAIAPVAVAVAALAFAVGTAGYTQRHGEASDELYADVLRWLHSTTDFASDRRPVLAGPLMRADILAGDRLEHRVDLMPLDADCDLLRAAMREGYLITPTMPLEPVSRRAAACLGGREATFAGEMFRVDFVR